MSRLKLMLAAFILTGVFVQSALALTCPQAKDLAYSETKGWTLNTADSNWHIPYVPTELTADRTLYFFDTWWDVDTYNQRPICVQSFNLGGLSKEEVDLLYTNQVAHPDSDDANWYKAYDEELYICEAQDPNQCVYPNTI